MKQVAAFLLALTTLAGCSDDGGSGAAADDSPDAGASQEMPVWQVGQYWSFIDADGGEFDLVVTADEGSTWLVLNNDLGNAMFDWNDDVSFLGSIQKSDLSGKQGNDKVQFFDWPLEHDKSWMTSWDGESRHVVAHAMEGKWHLAVHAGGSDADQTFAEMLYDPAIGWFESMIFYGEDGEEQYVLVLTGSGDQYIGNVHRYTDVNPEALTINTTGPAAHPQGTLSIKEGVKEMLVFVDIDCAGQPGIMGMGVQEPQEDGSQQLAPPVFTVVDQGPDTMGHIDQCPAATGSYEETRDDPRPGMWRADGVAPAPGQVLGLRVETRTYETFSF